MWTSPQALKERGERGGTHAATTAAATLARLTALATAATATPAAGAACAPGSTLHPSQHDARQLTLLDAPLSLSRAHALTACSMACMPSPSRALASHNRGANLPLRGSRHVVNLLSSSGPLVYDTTVDPKGWCTPAGWCGLTQGEARSGGIMKGSSRRVVGRTCTKEPSGPDTLMALARPSSDVSMANSTVSPSRRERKPSA